MTRHGLAKTRAADASPAATDLRAPMVTGAADKLTTSNVRGPLDCPEAQRSGVSESNLTLPSGGRAIADIGRRSKSP